MEQSFHLVLQMTPEQFEDYQYLKAQIRAKLQNLGIDDNEDVYWRECPPVTDEFCQKLRDALQCRSETQLIAYYPHSWHHRAYKEVIVEGVSYRWMSFQNGDFVKFAPSLANQCEAA